jgi:hypothetical protein
MSGRADIDNLVLATVLALGVPLEDKSHPKVLFVNKGLKVTSNHAGTLTPSLFEHAYLSPLTHNHSMGIYSRHTPT